MTDQKHEDTATDDGMPEVTVMGHPQVPESTEVLLTRWMHELEEVVHTFLTHQSSVGHERISSWLSKVKARSTPSTTPAPTETSPPSAPSTEEATEKSTSTT